MLPDLAAEQQTMNFQEETATGGKSEKNKKIIATGQDKGGQR